MSLIWACRFVEQNEEDDFLTIFRLGLILVGVKAVTLRRTFSNFIVSFLNRSALTNSDSPEETEGGSELLIDVLNDEVSSPDLASSTCSATCKINLGGFMLSSRLL